MKEFRKSARTFRGMMILGVILLCPTLGLWSFIMLAQWMEYKNNALILAKDGVIIKSGVFSKHINEIKYNKINSISVHKKWYANIGDIIIFAGNDITGIAFKGVDNPFAVKNEIDNIIPSH